MSLKCLALKSIPPKMGFGAGIGYNHGRVGEHLQTIHIDGVEALPQCVVRWEKIGIEVAHHRRTEVFHELWIREVVCPGKVCGREIVSVKLDQSYFLSPISTNIYGRKKRSSISLCVGSALF